MKVGPCLKEEVWALKLVYEVQVPDQHEDAESPHLEPSNPTLSPSKGQIDPQIQVAWLRLLVGIK